MDSRACIYCPSWYGHVHDPACPHETNLWPAHGDEACAACQLAIDDYYTLVELGPGVGLVLCVGCAALHAVEGMEA